MVSRISWTKGDSANLNSNTQINKQIPLLGESSSDEEESVDEESDESFRLRFLTFFFLDFFLFFLLFLCLKFKII